MKTIEIRKAVEKYSIEQLQKVENDIIEEKDPQIDLGGDDEGENLTHALAAIWILQEIKRTNADFNTAMRAYTKKVRTSIN